MTDARCQFEIYEISCRCGTKYQALVEPQEPHAKSVGDGDKYYTAGVKCPSCGNLAVFLGTTARAVTITGM